ncbi:hypothetical protein [Kribbella solani]|uniref:hypothetical protein n=1 Tax=Kribbella solani TaxID=236067 RepID=UPI0029AE484E|nr:hypothetical protein [Kribbella solani]MDX2968536.1 hypothetical protein [Kribbella solani]
MPVLAAVLVSVPAVLGSAVLVLVLVLVPAVLGSAVLVLVPAVPAVPVLAVGRRLLGCSRLF